MRKKPLLISLALGLLILPLLLPGVKEMGHTVNIAAPSAAILRQISPVEQFAAWWPGSPAGHGAGTFGRGIYQYEEAYVSSLALKATHGSLSTQLSIGAAGLSTQNTQLTLSATTRLSTNPYVRLLQHLAYFRLRQELQLLADSLALRFSNPDRLYGFHIQREKVKDATLVSLKAAFDHRPSTEEVYALINRLQAHIAARGARATNNPMLNIYPEEGGRQLTAQVAIPTDKALPEEGPFLFKRMLPNGNILMAEVKGGPSRVDGCLLAVENYVKDHNMMSPAIPFQSLVTDRMAEKDTAQWITRIYYPVF